MATRPGSCTSSAASLLLNASLVLALAIGLADRTDAQSTGAPANPLMLRDDPAGTLEFALLELAQRKNGRTMIERLVESGFTTVLVSKRLQPMQAGLWGPIFERGRVVGASLYLDLVQIRGMDHDPTGVETLAHELRHQVDASRAFLRTGIYRDIYLSAHRGDLTRSAQRYARRIRLQPATLSVEEARDWLASRVVPAALDNGVLVAQTNGRQARGANRR